MNLTAVILRGSRAGQPAASAVAAGSLYYVTDEFKTERSTGSAWESYTDLVASTPHALLDGSTHPDTAAGTPVRGDLIVGNSVAKWARLAKGTINQVFTMIDGNDPGLIDTKESQIQWEYS